MAQASSINMLKAAKKGDVELVKAFLDEGVWVDSAEPDLFHDTALNIASRNGHKEVVEVLLAADAEVDRQNDRGDTAFTIAAAEGEVKIVRLLLEFGADIDHCPIDYGRYCYSKRALVSAVDNGNFKLVKLLLKRGANLDVYNDFDKSVLEIAAALGHTNIVKILLNAGAKTTDYFCPVSNSFCVVCSGIVSAAQCGQTETVRFLLECCGVDVDENGRPYATPLEAAASNGHVDVVEMLLAANADVNKADGYLNRTALMAAAQSGHQEITSLLLEAGASIEQKQEDGRTALTIAAAYEPKCLKKLIEAGANVNHVDNDGQSALLINCHQTWISQEEQITYCEELLQAGAFIDLPDHDGNTPLFNAVRTNCSDLVKFLFKKGASASHVNHEGQTTLYMATYCYSFFAKCYCDLKPTVDMLLEHNVDVDKQDHNGNTAIGTACNNQVFGLIYHLLVEGANPKLKNKDGESALDIAERLWPKIDHPEYILRLLRKRSKEPVSLSDACRFAVLRNLKDAYIRGEAIESLYLPDILKTFLRKSLNNVDCEHVTEGEVDEIQKLYANDYHDYSFYLRINFD